MRNRSLRYGAAASALAPTSRVAAAACGTTQSPVTSRLQDGDVAVAPTAVFSELVQRPNNPEFEERLLWQPAWVGGRGALRFETVSTGEGLYEKGTRTYGYAVNRNGTAFLVFTMTPPGDNRYAQNKTVVDRAVHTLRFR